MSRVLPILFNTEMVRAILDGRKTVTRRIAKGVYPFSEYGDFTTVIQGEMTGPISMENVIKLKCKYQPGCIMYVRETWRDDRLFTHDDTPGQYFYKASAEHDFEPKWRPSIHMPKEAARIWLKVMDVRVERLQEMDCEDAMKEGIDPRLCANLAHTVVKFKKLWNSTLKKSDLDRYGWDANPWVWVIEFERCEKSEN